MTMVPATLPPPTHAGWRVAQTAALAGLFGMLLGFVTRPEATLRLLWFGVVPILPVILLTAPRLWRNVCPLASLETGVSRIGSLQRPSSAWSERASGMGMVMFAGLVPLRAVVFDASARAVLAAALVGVGLALAGGFLFRWKAGFCNAFCPMLPVERLYGQDPLVDVGNGRCGACVSCTPGACIDLAPRKSIPQLLGKARKSDDWLRTPFGLFTTCFPGLVVGYWLIAGPLAPPGPTVMGWTVLAVAYGTVATCALGTTLVLRGWTHARDWTWRTTTRASAALSATAFYGLTADMWAAAWNLGTGAAWAMRISAWLMVAVWLLHARRPAGRKA